MCLIVEKTARFDFVFSVMFDIIDGDSVLPTSYWGFILQYSNKLYNSMSELRNRYYIDEICHTLMNFTLAKSVNENQNRSPCSFL
jgi:hypothetical protein